MNTYRVTVMVTLDVEGIDRAAGAGTAISKVKQAVGDNGQSGRKMWVTGLGRNNQDFSDVDEYMIYEQVGR